MGLHLFLIRHEDAESFDRSSAHSLPPSSLSSFDRSSAHSLPPSSLSPPDNLPDTHRGLTALGRRRMRASAALFSSRETVDIIFTSPMVRAVQTTEILAAALGHDEPIHATRAVAEPQSVEEFLGVMDGLRADQKSVAIVGHEPTMSYVASHLLGSRLPRSFSKGMILALDYDARAAHATFRFLIDGDGPTLVTSLT